MEANQDKIEEKAKSLGRAIGQTDAAKALDRARDALKEDEETKELFEKVQRLEQNLMRKAQQGQDVSEDKREELQSSMQELETHKGFQQFISAQQNFENLMKEINESIQEGIEEGKDSNIIEI